MVDVAVAWPGADPAEIERRLLDPLEKALWGISAVEHVYGTARPGLAFVTVRFRVGESHEESLVKVYDRLAATSGQHPQGAQPPSVELHSIDDVPFLALTLWSPTLDSDRLRPIATELARELSEIPDTTRATVIGGQPRVVRVEPDVERLAASGVTWVALTDALRSGAARVDAGTSVRGGREVRLDAGPLFRSAADVERAVVGVRAGRPLYVRDVARVIDGPDEATTAVSFARGAGAGAADAGKEFDAVTVALAKRPGASATDLARTALAKVEAVRPRLLPADVTVEVTRDYGETARDKSNELGEHLLIATLSVVVLISLAMGWRSGLVVGVAVPVTLALTLFIYFLAGYTLNRVTLFALIFSIGILVDDAIVVVENIERHLRMKPGQPLARTAVEAVDEVGNPTILATFTVIAAILPMAFVRGMGGPYLRPIPTGATMAMLFSLAVAFVVSPWAARRVFARHRPAHDEARAEGGPTRLYRRVMTALLRRPGARLAFFAAVGAALLGAKGLVGAGLVRLKMLPFDNKSEMQVLVDHDEGTPLEVTLETARLLRDHLATLPEVKDVEVYAGTAAPFSFTGLARHSFLRRDPFRADLQVNLIGRHDRAIQSHDFAMAVRPALHAIGRDRRARVTLVEMPPGPPVFATLVAEVYGPTAAEREALARTVRGLFETEAGVVDVSDSLEAARTRQRLSVDAEKAGLHGASVALVAETLAGPGAGRTVGRIEDDESREPVRVAVRLSASARASLARRLSLRVPTPQGDLALGELARMTAEPEPQPIVHKDLKPVVYVFGDLTGANASPVYTLASLGRRMDAVSLPDGSRVARHAIEPPLTSDRPAIKWDGESQITYEVFRDLGIAFAVVLVLIALLVVGWFRSLTAPLAILLPIPLSLIGILPGHLLFGASFSATSMIGFIAGAGIIVRNSIILVDFIELKLGQGMRLEDAVVEAGVVRFRPMLLTAAAVVIGAFVILFDPIFQGLAISLMTGEVAATLLSRVAVPVVYFLLSRGRTGAASSDAPIEPELAA
jgi:multidrug efflux pump subunit AcrB